jgi:hypothetical protein
MPTSPGPSTSNNWGWAYILKRVFTLVELGLLQKWVAKPIGNKSDNTLKKGWVTTHSKQEVSDNTLKKVSTTAQENVYKKITKNQVERIERSYIELDQRFGLLSVLISWIISLTFYIASKLSKVMI